MTRVLLLSAALIIGPAPATHAQIKGCAIEGDYQSISIVTGSASEAVVKYPSEGYLLIATECVRRYCDHYQKDPMLDQHLTFGTEPMVSRYRCVDRDPIEVAVREFNSQNGMAIELTPADRRLMAGLSSRLSHAYLALRAADLQVTWETSDEKMNFELLLSAADQVYRGVNLGPDSLGYFPMHRVRGFVWAFDRVASRKDSMRASTTVSDEQLTAILPRVLAKP